MKRWMVTLIAICLAFLVIPSVSAVQSDFAVPMTGLAKSVPDRTADDLDYPDFCGRLCIPDVKIDVALYDSYLQSVCDREDSACCFKAPGYSGKIIGDHCNQDFATLTSVTVGTTATIIDAEGNEIDLICAAAFNGHNTGNALTDNSYRNVMGQYDYLTYTCMKGWQNVRICQWEIVEADSADNL